MKHFFRLISAHVAIALFIVSAAPVPAFALVLPGNLPVPLPAGLSADLPGFKRMIILYDGSVGQKHFAALEQIGGMSRRSFSLIPGIAAWIPEAQISALQHLPGVVRVVEDQVVQIQLQQSVPQIEADQVHANGNTGQGVRVCIVDTGVDDGHPAIPTLVAEYDFANDDSDAVDDHGHGTHVAGIVGSRDATYRGVAPGVDFMAAKVLAANGSGYTSDVIAGIDWCKNNGADVINMSLGGGGSSGICDDDPTAQAANAAVTAGVVVFAATGNNGYTNRVLSPACGSKVIAVGSVDKSDGRTTYSNEGTQVSIVAPGSSITAPYLNNGFGTLTGTSMATPHAAGAGALVLAANPALTPAQVRDILQTTAVDLGAAGFDTMFGHGRIDTLAAVTSAGTGGGDSGGSGGDSGGGDPVPVALFSDTFESGFGKWVEIGGTQWRGENASTFSTGGTGIAALADQCRTVPCTLRMSVPIDLRYYQSAALALNRFVDHLLDSSEYLSVQASANGSTWTELARWTDGQGADDTWHDEEFDLSAYMGGDLWIQFVTFQSSSFEDVAVDDVVVMAVPIGNIPPVAEAGADQILKDSDNNGTQSAVLNGAASSDPDGSISAYAWKEGATTLGTTASITPSLAVGVHTVMLMVTDNEGAIDTDTVLVTVQANTPPIANAGADQILKDSDGNGTQSAVLNGAVSSDPDGSISAYAWKEGATTLGTTASISPVLAVGAHTITLTVTDNGGATHTDTVLVTVQANVPPVAQAGADQTVGDGDNNGTQGVALNGAASSDADGTIVSYLWKEGATTLGTTASISPVLAVGAHTITLTVTDNGGAIHTDSVSVMITPNIAPLSNAGADQTIGDEDGDGSETVTLNGAASSDPDGSVVSYEWKEGATVLGTSASISPVLAVGAHTITLTVTDNGGLTTDDSVLIVVSANAVPVAQAGADQSVSDSDNNGTQSVTLNGAASSDPDGSVVSYEWKEGATVLGTSASISPVLAVGAHTITLTVTDNGGATHADIVLVTVLANDPPVAQAGADQTVEDTDGNGTQSITLDGALSTDPNGAIVAYEWKEGATVLGTSASISPVLAVGAHTITLTVTDNGGATHADTVIVTVDPRSTPPANPTAFFDAFAGGLGSWLQTGDGRWLTRSPSKVVPGSVAGNTVAHADNCDASCTITAAADLSAYSSATLSFWRFVDSSIDNGEFLRVDVSSNGGVSWTSLFSWTHRSGDDDTWRKETVNLGSFLTSGFQIRLVTTSSLSNETVEVDDVLITGVPL